MLNFSFISDIHMLQFYRHQPQRVHSSPRHHSQWYQCSQGRAPNGGHGHPIMLHFLVGIIALSSIKQHFLQYSPVSSAPKTEEANSKINANTLMQIIALKYDTVYNKIKHRFMSIIRSWDPFEHTGANTHFSSK